MDVLTTNLKNEIMNDGMVESLKNNETYNAIFKLFVDTVLFKENATSIDATKLQNKVRKDLESVFSSLLAEETEPPEDVFYSEKIKIIEIIKKYYSNTVPTHLDDILSEHYITMFYGLGEARLRLRQSKRKHFQYPPEAYDYKVNNDERPASDGYYACFH